MRERIELVIMFEVSLFLLLDDFKTLNICELETVNVYNSDSISCVSIVKLKVVVFFITTRLSMSIAKFLLFFHRYLLLI
jgi:hypothetical protein